MAEHNIFLGGLATRNGYYRGLPSTEPGPNGAMTGATHKHNGNFSLNRHLDWGCGGDCGPPSCCGSARSLFLHDYLSENNVRVGDVLNIMILPMQMSLLKVWWKITKPLAGFTFDLQVRGNADSLGGTLTTPVPISLATGLSGNVPNLTAPGCPDIPASGLIGIDPAAQGDPLAEGIYFNQNDMLQMVITALPPEGIGCSDMTISAVMESYCEGSY